MGPETVDAFFRHVQLRHPDLSEDGHVWPRLNQLVRAGMNVGPNTCYWPPSSGNSTGPSTRGTVRGRSRGDRRGNTYTRRAPQQQKEAAEQASRPDRKSRGQPFPIEMKEEGSRKRYRSISSNRAAESAHRHKQHSGQDSNLDPEQSGTDDTAASGKGKAKNSTPSSGLKTSGGGSGFPRKKDPDPTAVPIDSQCPGNRVRKGS